LGKSEESLELRKDLSRQSVHEACFSIKSPFSYPFYLLYRPNFFPNAAASILFTSTTSSVLLILLFSTTGPGPFLFGSFFRFVFDRDLERAYPLVGYSLDFFFRRIFFSRPLLAPSCFRIRGTGAVLPGGYRPTKVLYREGPVSSPHLLLRCVR